MRTRNAVSVETIFRRGITPKRHRHCFSFVCLLVCLFCFVLFLSRGRGSNSYFQKRLKDIDRVWASVPGFYSQSNKKLRVKDE